MTRGDSLAETPVGQAAVMRRTQDVVGLEPGGPALAGQGYVPGASTWAVQLLCGPAAVSSHRLQGERGRKPQPALFISSRLHYRVPDPRHAGWEGWRFFSWVDPRNPLLPCAGAPFCPSLPVLTGLRSSAWSLFGS